MDKCNVGAGAHDGPEKTFHGGKGDRLRWMRGNAAIVYRRVERVAPYILLASLEVFGYNIARKKKRGHPKWQSFTSNTVQWVPVRQPKR